MRHIVDPCSVLSIITACIYSYHLHKAISYRTHLTPIPTTHSFGAQIRVTLFFFDLKWFSAQRRQILCLCRPSAVIGRRLRTRQIIASQTPDDGGR